MCRNRTDRSTRGRPTGFEVPDGHQPACTSALILGDLKRSVNFGVLNNVLSTPADALAGKVPPSPPQIVP